MARTKILSIGGGSAFASGGVTNNVVPKSNGVGQLADSSITDDGTKVSTTEPIVVPDTAGAGAPSVKGATAATGLFLNGTVPGLISTTANWLTVAGNTAVSGAQVPLAGGYGISSSASIAAAGSDVWLTRKGAGNWRLGAADVNGAVVSQIISVQNAITGSNLVPGTLTIDAPLGTGIGAGGATRLNRTLSAATGTTAQTSANGFVVGSTKVLSNTSATAQAIANIVLASNSAGGCWVSITVTATDGTNFDSETQSANVSFVNKAGAITVGSAQITTSTAANNSGSATIGMTFVANGNSIDIKVTPVFTTIVPTIVTSYITIINNGPGAVTIN